MRFLVLLLLTGCASQLTEEERFQREYEENDRKAQYERWRDWCLSDDTDGVIFSDNPARPCRGRDCIPHRWDWDWDHESERPKVGNAIQCASRRQIEELMRGMSR